MAGDSDADADGQGAVYDAPSLLQLMRFVKEEETELPPIAAEQPIVPIIDAPNVADVADQPGTLRTDAFDQSSIDHAEATLDHNALTVHADHDDVQCDLAAAAAEGQGLRQSASTVEMQADADDEPSAQDVAMDDAETSASVQHEPADADDARSADADGSASAVGADDQPFDLGSDAPHDGSALGESRADPFARMRDAAARGSERSATSPRNSLLESPLSVHVRTSPPTRTD